MKILLVLASIASLAVLAGCESYHPRQISNEQLNNGMPPLTGVLPNGVMEDSATK
ncbi:hypothetical protein [Lichenicoccus roseus]|uniref:hypothetical protein n=1 Tax=Lichenicoccus roseus TaxID=2683649 RepID=UPI00148606D7|nr:hypothetical protein [Lichenicoccus roseus]